MNHIQNAIGSHKSEVITVIIFLFSTGLFLICLSYLHIEIDKYISMQKDISALENTYAANDLISSNIKKTSIDVHAYINTLPTQNTVIKWVEQTENIAKATNVQQTLTFASGQLTKDSILIPPQSGATGVPSISGNIVVKGSYNAVLSYIAMLQKDYYYTKIDGMTFSNSTANGPSTTTPPTPTPKNPQSGGVVTNVSFHLFVKETQSGPLQ